MPTTSDAAGPRPAIALRDVSVRYRMPHERFPTIKEYVIQWLRRRVVITELRALSNVDLVVQPGESIGIIGRNGAGKTTLMKVIARVLRPVGGVVEVRGTVAPLLELGAGFDPELTGRENVFLNGAILRRSRKEMQARFADIVAFSELEAFIDAPLRTYSTGMVARLGFAVATDCDPDVLLVDEVLSVGDIEFQRKCMRRIDEFRARGATLVMVSHSLESVIDVCRRAIWIDAGRIVADGPSAEVVGAFVAHAREAEGQPHAPPPIEQTATG